MSATTKLPARAELKFASLRDGAEEARDRMLANQRRIGVIEDQRRRLSENDAETFDALTEEIERVSQLRDRNSENFNRQMRVVTAIRTWMLGLPGNVEFSDVDQTPRPDEIPDSEATEEGVMRCREEIDRLRVQRASAARSVPPIPDLYLAAAQHVEALAARGRPIVALVEGRLIVRHDGDKNPLSPRDAVVAVAAWLHPDVMLERLHEQIDATHEEAARRGVQVMTVQERDKKIADVERRILQLEREEEFFIGIGEEYGMTILRRDDANPLAMLGVVMHKRERAAA
jgi:hypothetical protein